MQESSRHTTGQFLKFAGLLLTVGGSLATLRTRGVEDAFFDNRPWFFLALIPVGLVVWFVGFRFCITPPKSTDPATHRELHPRG